MKRLIVSKKDGYDYYLKDLNNEYKLNIEFYDICVNIGDYIYLDEDILKEKNLFCFGNIKSNNLSEKDLIKVVHENKEYYLERYYG